MSSVISSWFYVLTLGISALLLVALVFIFYNPSMFLQLTSSSGQLIDLSQVNNFNPATNETVAATAQSAVITIGSNSYTIADNPVSVYSNAFIQPGINGITAANDLANCQITGTFLFWVLMLGIGFLSLLLAFIAVRYPESLFGPQISALVRCLPKRKSSCSSSRSAPSSSSCSVSGNSNSSSGQSSKVSAQQMIAQAAATQSKPKPVTPAPSLQQAQQPKPQVQQPATSAQAAPNAGAVAGWTPQQIAMLQSMLAVMSAAKPAGSTQ